MGPVEGLGGEFRLPVRGVGWQGSWLGKWTAAIAHIIRPAGAQSGPRRSNPERFAFPDAVRYEPDRRHAGYYVDNTDDWPDEVSSTNISAPELMDVVSRFREVYDSAMMDISKEPKRR